MKSSYLVVSTFAVLLLFGVQGASAFPSPTDASGTFPPTTTLYVKVTSPVSFDILSIGPITGTFAGFYTATGSVVESSIGANYTATDTCFCSVTTKTGTYVGVTVFSETGTVIATSETSGVLSSVAFIVFSTIPGLSGYVDFSGTTNLTTFTDSGSYTGQILVR